MEQPYATMNKDLYRSKNSRTAPDVRHHPRGKGKLRKGGRERWSAGDAVLHRYEASVARALAYREKRIGMGRQSAPDMHSWAAALGVDITSSKRRERDRRKMDGKERTHNVEDKLKLTRSVRDSRASEMLLQFPAGQGERHGTIEARRTNDLATDAVALDGFLSDLNGRLSWLETGTTGVNAAPANGSFTRRRGQGPTEHGGEAIGCGSVDVYGVPRIFMENVEDVRGNLTNERHTTCMSQFNL